MPNLHLELKKNFHDGGCLTRRVGEIPRTSIEEHVLNSCDWKSLGRCVVNLLETSDSDSKIQEVAHLR